MDNSEQILSVENLHKYYGDNHILKGISFKANRGQLISIIGRSGCGKTTLLRCLNCLEILDSGTIDIAGINLTRKESPEENLKKVKVKRNSDSNPLNCVVQEELFGEDIRNKVRTLRMRVGMLFQDLNLFPNLTVLENISLSPIIVKKFEKNIANEESMKLLEKVGMEKYIKRYPYQLSGGQAQRVAIARALAMSPDVMLYDEPTSALDPELINEVVNVMRNLHDEGMTQIIVTHTLNFAKNVSDKIIYMEDGEFIEESTPEILFSNPKDERTRQYLKLFIQ